MKKKILFFLLALLPVVGMQAQIYDENGQYVDTIFHDHINRQADDFVKAYFCVAEPTDWRDDFLGVNGHAFIRLVCDAFDMDYCFSYESESTDGQMDKYLQGKLKMGMYAVPTEEYLVDFINWKRAVHQYKLNLPPDVKQRLWQILDGHVMEGNQLKLDLDKRGCSVSAVRYIVKALGDLKIQYPEDLSYKEMTLREIQYQSMENFPWMRLAYDTWLDDLFNEPKKIEGKMIVPIETAMIWEQSTLLDKPVLEYDCDIVEAPIVENKKPWLTPLRLAWLLLLVTIVLALVTYFLPSFRGYTYWIWLWLGLLLPVSGGLVYVTWLVHQLSWSVGIVTALFNILPLLCWRWRNYWQLPYAIVLAVGALILWLWPHMVVDPFYVVMALNYAVLYGANWVLEKKDDKTK